MTRTNSGKSPVGVVLVLAAVVVLGIAAYVKFAPADEIPREEETLVDGSVTLVIPTYDEKLDFSSEPVKVPEGVDQTVFAVNLFLDQLDVVPSDAVAEKIELNNGIASVYFSSEFRRSYGTEDEQILVNGLLVTLGQFPEIEFAKFYAGGRPLETFGNIDLTDPLPVIRRPDLDVDD
ncbi:MAG: GerMN domain-containing protein [Armatimonadetes bacterium]|nr:GerMN domain-containing protein [Armatimonadota bacterium]